MAGLPDAGPVVPSPGPATTPSKATHPTNGAGTASTSAKPASWEITLDVAPKKPRLAWQGMWRKEVAVSVPTQVVEIVRPGRAIRAKGRAGARDADRRRA